MKESILTKRTFQQKLHVTLHMLINTCEAKLFKSYFLPGALHGETKLEAASPPSPIAKLMAPGVIQHHSLLALSTSLKPWTNPTSQTWAATACLLTSHTILTWRMELNSIATLQWTGTLFQLRLRQTPSATCFATRC